MVLTILLSAGASAKKTLQYLTNFQRAATLSIVILDMVTLSTVILDMVTLSNVNLNMVM
jgi:hypothetical protein